MSAILSWSRSDSCSSKAFMGAGSTFSGKSPMSRSAFDALSRYCNGDLTATSAMPASCKRQVQDLQNPFATTMAGKWPDRALPPARQASALLEHAPDGVPDAAPTAAIDDNPPLGPGPRRGGC